MPRPAPPTPAPRPVPEVRVRRVRLHVADEARPVTRAQQQHLHRRRSAWKQEGREHTRLRKAREIDVRTAESRESLSFYFEMLQG